MEVYRLDKAIDVNIQIVRVFTEIRQMLSANAELKLEIEKIKKKLNNQNKNIEVIFKYFDGLPEQ